MSAVLHDVSRLEARASAALGARVLLDALRADAADAGDAGEAPGASVRKRDWRRGRAALSRLLARAGRDERADDVRFPHPALSLSHSGDWAVAAARDAAGGEGLGVDLEFARAMDPRAARFFLAGDELAHVAALAPARRDHELLRLWTAKEAVFKACAGNAGLLLVDFQLDAPAALTGTARRVDGAAFIARYVTLDLGDGWLAVALAATGTRA